MHKLPSLHSLHSITTAAGAASSSSSSSQLPAGCTVDAFWSVGPLAATPPPSPLSVALTQTSKVALAHRKLKKAALNEPSCLCLLSVWHMKDMWLCEAWRPYQHMVDKTTWQELCNLVYGKLSHPSESQETSVCVCGHLYM